MEDFFEDLYDESTDGEEPSFSLGDFKKWLAKQKKADKKIEDKEKRPNPNRPQS